MRVEHMLERRAHIDGDKTAVVCGEERRTYREIEERSNLVARSLLDAGLQTGDRVAICLENSIETIVSLFGVLKAGGVFVIIAPHTPLDRRCRILADSGASALISRNGIVDSGCRTPSADRVDDLAALVYTSGSTGEPKGVMLTHRNLTSAAASICSYLELTSNDVILNVLPLAFTYGLGQVTTAFHAGATLVLERSFAYPQAVISTMLRERVTGLPLVPTIATILLQELRDRRLPHLRYITNAAAALSRVKIQRLREAFPQAAIYSMYGLTECQRVSYLPPDQIDTRSASVGIPIPGTEAYVVDERGERVAAGTIGELVVKGPHVMAGYWNQAKTTAGVLRQDAAGATVLHTGDLFRMDEDGFLYFVERTDDIIKVRGEKVAPRQVEEVIARLDGVAEVAVYGVPDELSGQAIAAVVTPAPGAMLSVERVKRHCLDHLGTLMVPKIVDIRDALPTTATGKISRRALQATAPQAGQASA